MLREMFKKTSDARGAGKKVSVPEGLWIKCPHCRELLYKEAVAENRYVCYQCGGYFRVKAGNRLRMIADPHSVTLWDGDLQQPNPLEDQAYGEKLQELQEKTRLQDAVVTGKLRIDGEEAVVGVCDVRFLMGSMGYAAGEKITRAVERATALGLPVILFTASGGARMQEGMISLMQMAKTAAAMKKHSQAGLLAVTVLTDPTTGGVTASFAMLGDLILAEPGALIGFAGPRVIEQTIGQKLPEGFQRSEFLLEHGMIDLIVERPQLKETLARLIRLHQKQPAGSTNLPAETAKTQEETAEQQMRAAKPQEERENPQAGAEKSPVGSMAGLSGSGRQEETAAGGKERTPWEKVLLARDGKRPASLEYIRILFPDFLELHGDRAFGDDGAIIGGIASFHGRPVTVIGQQKGKNAKENRRRNFGMPCPEGYRKALRLMKQAEKYGRPILCLIDTPGAYCGIGAEERGQGEAIARNLAEMSALQVPVLSLVIGEGSSGGALALAVANEVWMLENAVYSILSPEGYASILWKDSKKAPEAARKMRLTAQDLKRLGVIEKVIPEPEPLDGNSLPALCERLDREIAGFLERFCHVPGEALAEHRYRRFRKL